MSLTTTKSTGVVNHGALVDRVYRTFKKKYKKDEIKEILQAYNQSLVAALAESQTVSLSKVGVISLDLKPARDMIKNQTQTNYQRKTPFEIHGKIKLNRFVKQKLGTEIMDLYDYDKETKKLSRKL